MIDKAYAMASQTSAGNGEAASPLMGILPIILIFGVFYFLLIRPQKKKMKKHKEMVNSLKKGDRVVTGGGIYGRITSLKGKQAEVEIASGTRVTANKQSLSREKSVEAEVVSK